MKKIKIVFLLIVLNISNAVSNETSDFDNWKVKFKNRALASKISENTIDLVLSNMKYLPKVIQYDRYQPEFYEDTKTYIEKRTSKQTKANQANI